MVIPITDDKNPIVIVSSNLLIEGTLNLPWASDDDSVATGIGATVALLYKHICSLYVSWHIRIVSASSALTNCFPRKLQYRGADIKLVIVLLFAHVSGFTRSRICFGAKSPNSLEVLFVYTPWKSTHGLHVLDGACS